MSPLQIWLFQLQSVTMPYYDRTTLPEYGMVTLCNCTVSKHWAHRNCTFWDQPLNTHISLSRGVVCKLIC